MLDADTKVLGALTMARKAGKVVLGFDAVKDTLGAGTARITVITADISPKTEKEVRFFCERSGTDVIKTGCSMEDIGRALGKRSGVLSVTDEGLAGLVRKHKNEPLKPMEEIN
jgi:ribosomal protein L7Ae-like RNA K-turn-binding protein